MIKGKIIVIVAIMHAGILLNYRLCTIFFAEATLQNSKKQVDYKE